MSRGKEWELSQEFKYGQTKESVTAQIIHSKKIYDSLADKTEGTAFCMIWAVKEVNGKYTKGKYEVHAQARGRLWYIGDKKKNSYFAGISTGATKKASRRIYTGEEATYSGVHLKGKAHVNYQEGGLRLELNWL